MSSFEGEEEGIATLRASHARVGEVETRNTALERENAILKAGIDMSTPVGAMFAKAYEGPLTPEDMRKAAIEVGALAPPPTEATLPPAAPVATATPEEIAGAEARQTLTSGTPDPSGTTPPPPEDPTDAGYKEFHELLAQGRPRDAAAIAVIGRTVAAGAAGNPKYVLPANGQPAEWAEMIAQSQGRSG